MDGVRVRFSGNIAAIPLNKIVSCPEVLKDISSVAYAVGPLILTVSVTLASIFYSAGPWYASHQKFEKLGLIDGSGDRKGRSLERRVHWQKVLNETKDRIVISGTTLGGWFVNDWEETREALLRVLASRAQVRVLLARPDGHGFAARANDPGEQLQAMHTEQARPSAASVYKQIGKILEDPEFLPFLTNGRLSFHVYPDTPLSAVWVDDDLYFTPYLPCKGDKDCPELVIRRAGEIGATIANSIEQLLQSSTQISTAADALIYQQLCEG